MSDTEFKHTFGFTTPSSKTEKDLFLIFGVRPSTEVVEAADLFMRLTGLGVGDFARCLIGSTLNNNRGNK